MSQEHVRPNDTSRGRVGTETETAQQTRTKINGNGHRPTSETRRGGDFPTNCKTHPAARYFHFTVSIPGALPRLVAQSLTGSAYHPTKLSLGGGQSGAGLR